MRPPKVALLVTMSGERGVQVGTFSLCSIGR